MKTSAVLSCAALCAAAWTCAPAGASEPASEIRVVYPASATSCEPILADGVKGLSAKPPVKENGRLEIETPLGQIREVRDTLAAIRQTQTELARGIETLVSRAPAPDRADEILAAIERASASRAEQEAKTMASMYQRLLDAQLSEAQSIANQAYRQQQLSQNAEQEAYERRLMAAKLLADAGDFS
ncbi:MAG: hypothetical protein II486_12775, partial [Thermoguttaceae bacterium]|nr:hypothetical protein [Thermoguttaceae bacterium]